MFSKMGKGLLFPPGPLLLPDKKVSRNKMIIINIIVLNWGLVHIRVHNCLLQ